MDGAVSNPTPGSRAQRRPGRASFPERQRRERVVARQRVLARASTTLTPAQRMADPLEHGDRNPARRLGKAALALLGSTGVHLGVVLLGVMIGGLKIRRDTRSGEVTIQVQEHRRKPPPPPPPPPPLVERKRERPARVETAPPPPSEPTPSAPPKSAPVRVVGLSLDSTSAGGGGPSFAVGNTRMGETAERAVEPRVEPQALTASPLAPEAPAAKANQAASRIPVVGVKYTAPKRRKPSKPPYPETLKSQGVEADVTVMVSIDAAGLVTEVKIIKPAPYPEFNDAAEAAARAEEFEPATKDGVPMAQTISFTYRWRLEEQQ